MYFPTFEFFKPEKENREKMFNNFVGLPGISQFLNAVKGNFFFWGFWKISIFQIVKI